MLKETEIEQTIGFVVIHFIIGGILIGGPLPPPPGYAYDFWPINSFLFLI